MTEKISLCDQRDSIPKEIITVSHDLTPDVGKLQSGRKIPRGIFLLSADAVFRRTGKISWGIFTPKLRNAPL